MSQTKPTPWHVRYEDNERYRQALVDTNGYEDAVDWMNIEVEEDATSQAQARLICRTRGAAHRIHGSVAEILQRRNIQWDDDEEVWEWKDKVVAWYHADRDQFERAK